MDILTEIHQERQVKEGWKDIALGTAMTAASLFGGDDIKAQTPQTLQKPGIEKTISTPEAQIKKFLISPEGTYGWRRLDGRIIYDFLKDGRLLIFGSEGEVEMFEGRWILKGDKLTVINNTFNDIRNADKVFATKTFPVKIVKGNLVLGDQVFKRYKQ